MLVDISTADYELIMHALSVLQDSDGNDDGAEELETRLRDLKAATDTPQATVHMGRLQAHVARYFELSMPLEYDPERMVAVRLHREAQLAAETISVAEALLFSPLWKLIREWKAEEK